MIRTSLKSIANLASAPSLTGSQAAPSGRIPPDGVLMNSVQLAPTFYRFRKGPRRRVLIPVASSTVCAGFPSPADDHLEGEIDLNEFCIEQPAATYFLRAAGKSMTGGMADIHEGDLLVVNRAVKARSGHVVIACLDGEFCVKRLRLTNQQAWLDSDNEQFSPIPVNAEADVTIWGVVRAVVRQTR